MHWSPNLAGSSRSTVSKAHSTTPGPNLTSSWTTFLFSKLNNDIVYASLTSDSLKSLKIPSCMSHRSNLWKNDNIESYSVNRLTQYLRCGPSDSQCFWSRKGDHVSSYDRGRSYPRDFSFCTSTKKSSPCDNWPRHFPSPLDFPIFLGIIPRPDFNAFSIVTDDLQRRDVSKPPILASKSRYAISYPYG